ncbi:hypothetical protein C8Q74DRAFT_243181 [Fomes fomentarius]|nr:hypothetical protein C8Q74DRAFT_243181 [Fomes fomentarius]
MRIRMAEFHSCAQHMVHRSFEIDIQTTGTFYVLWYIPASSAFSGQRSRSTTMGTFPPSSTPLSLGGPTYVRGKYLHVLQQRRATPCVPRLSDEDGTHAPAVLAAAASTPRFHPSPHASSFFFQTLAVSVARLGSRGPILDRCPSAQVAYSESQIMIQAWVLPGLPEPLDRSRSFVPVLAAPPGNPASKRSCAAISKMNSEPLPSPLSTLPDLG